MIWFDAFESKLNEDIEFYNQTWPERYDLISVYGLNFLIV